MTPSLLNQKYSNTQKTIHHVHKRNYLKLLGLLLMLSNICNVKASESKDEINTDLQTKKQKISDGDESRAIPQKITEKSFEEWLEEKCPKDEPITDLIIKEEDVAYILFQFETKRNDLTLESYGDIIFDKNINIKWSGNSNLFLTACGNIIFKEGSQVKNIGNGGVKLQSGNWELFYYGSPCSKGSGNEKIESFKKFVESTVIFETDHTQLNFSESSGFVTIYYNPLAIGEKHKFENPTDFSKSVRVQNNSFKAFMAINWKTDLIKDITANLSGDYYLNGPPTKYLKQLSQDLFTGSFLYNCLSIEGNYIYSAYFGFEHYFFEFALKNIWGNQVFNSYPPYNDSSREAELWCAISNNDQNYQSEISGSSYKTFAYINDTDYTTPLHYAAKLGHTSFIEKIVSSILDIKINVISDVTIDDKHTKLLFCFLNRRDKNDRTPLFLAAENGHIETAVYLIKLYNKFKWNYNKDQIHKMVLDQQTAILSRYQEIIDFSNSLDENPRKLTTYWQGFPNENKALEKEYQRQQKVNEKFFHRNSNSSRTQTIFKKFEEAYGKKSVEFFMNLEGIPSRSRIMLINSITKHKAQFDKQKKWTDQTDRCPIKCKFAESTVTLENKPTTNKPGYIYISQIGAYSNKDEERRGNEIDTKIKEIEEDINSTAIAKLLQWSRITGNSITVEALTQYGYKGQRPKEHSKFLNTLNLLLDVEVSSRLFRDEKNTAQPHDELPIGSSNARSYMLQRIKAQTFDQFFSKSGAHHAFTDTGNSVERKQAIHSINMSFYRNLVTMNVNNYQDLEIQHWKKYNPHGVVIATQEGLHRELLAEYGGGYESDGDEYISDND